jgi:hypothetical protein
MEPRRGFLTQPGTLFSLYFPSFQVVCNLLGLTCPTD